MDFAEFSYFSSFLFPRSFSHLHKNPIRVFFSFTRYILESLFQFCNLQSQVFFSFMKNVPCLVSGIYLPRYSAGFQATSFFPNIYATLCYTDLLSILNSHLFFQPFISNLNQFYSLFYFVNRFDSLFFELFYVIFIINFLFLQ